MRIVRQLIFLTVVTAACTAALLLMVDTSSAESGAEAAPSVEVITISAIETPSPTPMPSPVPTPTPTPRPELPIYDYHAEDARCLSRAIWSICPVNPTRNTKVAFAELVQNRVDDDSGDFKESIRWVLLQGNEFEDYNADAYRSRENNEIADYAMRSWIFATVTGDRSYRLTPTDGLYCDFYRTDSWDYITIYNRSGDVVYDSGSAK